MKRVFNTRDQQEFAQLSGDFNPLHMDSLIARRLMSGQPVVHGVHLVAWALEQALAKKTRLKSLKAHFLHPVTLGMEMGCTVSKLKNGVIQATLHCDGVTKSIIKFTIDNKKSTERVVVDKPPPKTECKTWNLSEISEANGYIDLTLSQDALRRVFPNLSRLISCDQLSFLFGITRLIGMECPGLHSLFSKMDVFFSESDTGLAQKLHWRVTEFDSRVSLINMEIKGHGAAGTITAFLRPPPQDQPSFLFMKNVVDPSAFAKQSALVIGGSRGLGEVTAKLLAAGGAKVYLTYHRGEEDAQNVVDDITENGGKAYCSFFNVLDQPEKIPSPTFNDFQPTHLYYFATPPIFVANKGQFSQALFEKFCTFYVEGFLNTVTMARIVTKDPLKVLYASSAALDNVPVNMGEYSAAKAAGESLCKFLMSLDRDLSIWIERFPRILTDQTVSLIQMETFDPVDVLSKILKEMI